MRFDRLRRDLRFGLRTHSGTPVITLVIITTLALGIAASTLTFSLVNGLFLRPPPIRDPQRFVRVYHQANNSTQFLPVSYPEFDDLVEMRDVFDGGVLEEPLPLRVGTGAWSVRAFGERAPLVLMIVCLASIGLPLRRAIRVNAATALRCE